MSEPTNQWFWQVGDRSMDLSRRGRLMGILNVTPDSFSDGNRHRNPQEAVEHALQMVAEGAEIIDIGGESTRPGSAAVPLETEIRRVLPVLRLLRQQTSALLSIDTSKAGVARRALDEGADIVNDVTALRGDPQMAGVVAASNCGVVLMHMRGTPATMQQAPEYGDVVAEVTAFLRERTDAAGRAGIAAARVVVDPGFGFGKTAEHNRLLLAGLETLCAVGRPLLAGLSRKSCLAAMTGTSPVEDRLWPCVALTAFCREAGARIFRVHDITPNLHAVRMTEALLGHA